MIVSCRRADRCKPRPVAVSLGTHAEYRLRCGSRVTRRALPPPVTRGAGALARSVGWLGSLLSMDLAQRTKKRMICCGREIKLPLVRSGRVGSGQVESWLCLVLFVLAASFGSSFCPNSCAAYNVPSRYPAATNLYGFLSFSRLCRTGQAGPNASRPASKIQSTNASRRVWHAPYI
jgi:hypothetical protein